MSIRPIVLQMTEQTQFSEPTAVAAAMGVLIPSTRVALSSTPEGQGVSIGIWECTRGVWRRQVSKREFSHFLSGHCLFTPDGQEPIELRAGDSVYFPANCMGVWDIREDVRKSYVIFD